MSAHSTREITRNKAEAGILHYLRLASDSAIANALEILQDDVRPGALENFHIVAQPAEETWDSLYDA